MKRKKKNRIRYFAFLGAVFLCAFIFYLLLSYKQMEKSQTVYASMDEARLPVIYAERNGQKINPMHAYLMDMGNAAARDSITVLPEDRQLTLYIEEYDKIAASVQYEIRSTDLERLLEKGSLDNVQHENGEAKITLPIQNLLDKDTEYLLKLTVDTGEQLLNYYTRIVWTDHSYVDDMLSLACSFSEQSFSKTDARNMTGYLETSENADNSSLAHVTLQSSFQQITWGDTGMTMDGDITATIREYDGIMSEIQLNYDSTCSDGDGNVLHFRNEDNFVLRYDPTRMYIMSFDRRTEQKLNEPAAVDGERLKLGVVNEEKLNTLNSETEQFTAFTDGQELFRYDEKARKLTKLFSFASEQDESIRSGYTAHGIKLLRVQNNGDVDFAVYGYMNRGEHEGYTGILYETYDNSEDTLKENLFVPIADSFEELEYDFKKLLYLNQDGMLYFYYDGNVLGIDCNSSEVMNIVGGLSDLELVTSEDGRYIAFQDPESSDIYHSKKLTLMDLESEGSTEIQEDGRMLRVLGFIGSDMVYGIADTGLGDVYTESWEIPVLEIKIRAEDGSIKSDYLKENLYFANMEVTDGRVRFDELSYDGSSFHKMGSDSIISNKETKKDTTVSYKQDTVLEKMAYLTISDIGGNQLQESSPKRFSIEKSASIDISGSLIKKNRQELLRCYALGHMVGKARTMAEASNMVYDRFGYVTDSAQDMLWNRCNRKNICSVRSPQDKLEEMQTGLESLQLVEKQEDMVLLNLNGMDLGSVLYYVSHGMPVLAYEGDSFRLIYAYDAYNISLMDPETGEQTVMGREDAATYYAQYENRYVGALIK